MVKQALLGWKSDAAEQNPAKRLAAILFADAVGFTSWTSRDEDNAFAVLDDFLTSTAYPMLDHLGARTQKNLGDGLLATFDNVASAVAFAESLNDVLSEDRSIGRPRWKGLRFRVGINYSTVLFANDDVFGDGVNLAKRLQETAVADSIVLSHAAFEDIRKTRPEKVRDLGFIALKGFERPVRAYAMHSRGEDVAAKPRAEDEIPSIAILPFESLGASDEDLYFSDGLVEDLIASLSSLHEMVVISRASTLGFRDCQIDPKEARRVLGVRYVLQGTVRRRGATIMLSVTLNDTETGATLLSKRAEIAEEQIFDQQDQLVADIVSCIAPQVRHAELDRALRKPAEVFSAYDCYLRALDLMRRLTPESYAEARKFLDQAICEDPKFAAPYCWRAAWWIMMVVQGWTQDRDAATRSAEKDAKRAVELDDTNAQAVAVLAQTKAFMLGDHEAALALMERARHIGPGNTFVLMISAGTMAYVGRGQEAVKYAEQAHQLVPLDQIPFREFDWLSIAHYSAGHYARAAYWARRALDEQAGHLPSLRLLAASLAAVGDIAGAKGAADRLLFYNPGFRVDEYARAHSTFVDHQLQQSWLKHLRMSGLPG